MLQTNRIQPMRSGPKISQLIIKLIYYLELIDEKKRLSQQQRLRNTFCIGQCTACAHLAK